MASKNNSIQDKAMHYEGGDLNAMDNAQNYHKWIADSFAPYMGRRVAEVGAGSGGFSRILLDAASSMRIPLEHLDCYEPSDMFAKLQERLAGDSRVTCRNSYFAVDGSIEKYDSIIYVNVLEHIEDDKAELQKVYATLRTGGHVLIFVPALQFLYSDYDKKIGHYRRYTKKSLIKVTQSASFKTVFCHWFDSMGILPWYVKFVLLKGGMGNNSGGGG